MSEQDGNNAGTKPDDAKGEATKTEPIDVTGTPEFKGLLRDKQTETANRQEAERQLMSAQNALDEANRQLEEQAAKEELGEDDYLTVGATQKMIDKAMAGIKADKVKDQQQQKDVLAEESADRAKAKYTAENCGAGLDFESVFNDGLKPLLAADPSLITAIQNSRNPAEAAYKLGRTHPVIEKRHEERLSAKLVADLQKNSGPQRTGEQALVDNANAEESNFLDLMKKDEATLVAELEKLEKAG